MKNNTNSRMTNIIEFSHQLQELIYENIELKEEVERLRKVEQEYQKYIEKTYNATGSITNAWITEFLNGNITIKKE